MKCDDCGRPLSGPAAPTCWYPAGTHNTPDDTAYVVFEGTIAPPDQGDTMTHLLPPRDRNSLVVEALGDLLDLLEESHDESGVEYWTSDEERQAALKARYVIADLLDDDEYLADHSWADACAGVLPSGTLHTDDPTAALADWRGDV